MSSFIQNVMHEETNKPRNTSISTDCRGSGQSQTSVNDSGYESMQYHAATFTLGEGSSSSNSFRSDVMHEEDSDIEYEDVFENETIQPSQMTNLRGDEDAQQNSDLSNTLQAVSSPIDIPARGASGRSVGHNFQHTKSDPLFGARCEPRGFVPSYEAATGRCNASSQTETYRNPLGLKLQMAPRLRSNTIANHDCEPPTDEGTSGSLPDVVPPSRDRSLSMPNVQLCIQQRKIGKRLRRMSDDFHEEKQQMRRNSQSQASSMPSGFQYFTELTESLRRIVSGHFTHPD
ncbi:uncharacterized protein LOC127869291 isoform X2 [Dreissena polymorpha]|nr:uncharacterized protein LOC127869291 isoform X2 [Dreissena polymorpha]